MNDSLNVPLRLQKFLARAGVASRRGSEALMSAGRVSVNGVIVTELGSKVDPLIDVVAVDGVTVNPAQDPVTLMLHKPAGFITTMTDPYGRPCVADLVPTEQYPGLYPIGRLDQDTTGLLLFTTDGQLGNSLLHPKHHVDKVYQAWVEGTPSEEALTTLRNGVDLEDGVTAPAEVEMLQEYKATPFSCGSGRFAKTKAASKNEQKTTLVNITIHEGKKHQVKRMFDAVGFPVQKLHRVRFGPLILGDLEQGSWRLLQKDEQELLYGLASKES